MSIKPFRPSCPVCDPWEALRRALGIGDIEGVRVARQKIRQTRESGSEA